MGEEKIFKIQENRNDLAGEHKLGDLGQFSFAVIFLTVWIIDYFFVQLTPSFSQYSTLLIRIMAAFVIFIIAGLLAKKGLTMVFAEIREKPMVIRTGVFRVVRHPIYLGAILFYLAFLAVYFSLPATFVWIIIVQFYVYLCKHEEKLLIEKYGNDYEQYKLETPMILPRLIKRKNKV